MHPTVPAGRKPKSKRSAAAPPAPSRASTRTRNPPGEWWKVVHPEQYRDPSPAVPEEHPDIDMDDLEADVESREIVDLGELRQQTDWSLG